MTVGVFGCDNAGKTTTIRGLCGEIQDPEQGATFGMKSYLHKEGSRTIKLLDLGGGQKFRKFWQNNFPEMHGMIFVIDAACPERFNESAGELFEMLTHPLVEGKPVLILANKQDLPGARSQGALAKEMELNEKLTAKKWQIQECVALIQEEGAAVDSRLHQGVDWLCDAIASDYEALSERVTHDSEEAVRKAKAAKEAAKEARRKKKEERERKQAAEAAEAAMASTEQAQVAVPMKLRVEPQDQPAAELPPLRHPAKTHPEDLLISGSPLPPDPKNMHHPNVPGNLPSPTKLDMNTNVALENASLQTEGSEATNKQ